MKFCQMNIEIPQICKNSRKKYEKSTEDQGNDKLGNISWKQKLSWKHKLTWKIFIKFATSILA